MVIREYMLTVYVMSLHSNDPGARHGLFTGCDSDRCNIRHIIIIIIIIIIYIYIAPFPFSSMALYNFEIDNIRVLL